MAWYEGVYDGVDQWGVIGGGTVHRDFYGYYPSNPTWQDQTTMFFSPQLPGGGGGGGGVIPGGGIGINIPLPGGGTGPSVNQTLTQIVNGYEQALIANLGAFTSGNRSAADAIREGWRLMDNMVIACRAYGAAGERSAAERDRRINPSMLRWDWVAYYIDPITGAPTTPPPVPGGGVGFPGGGGGVTPPLPGALNFNDPLFLGLIVLAVILIARK